LQEQLDQVRAENRELRMMVEKIASGLKQSDKPQVDKPQIEKPELEERMLLFAERAIQRKDTDKNGVLTPDEFKGASGTSFSDVDTNQDGKIDIKEYATYISRR
jgi:Ca2+-binding EF-hand superfamily protein